MSILDSRLQAVLALIPEGSILLDIGTDHCKLPAEGLLSGRLSAAYAADVREGPLSAARKQLVSFGLAERIPLFLSDGLQAIPPNVLHAATAVSVAGMGGEVIQAILEQAPVCPPLWVLQPMSAIYELLDYLAAQGFPIRNAALAQCGEKFYRAFAVQKTDRPYSAEYFAMHRGDPLLPLYLQREQQRAAQALSGLKAAKVQDAARIKKVEHLLKIIQKERTLL